MPVTLRIRPPQGASAPVWFGISEQIMQVLYKRFGIIENYEVQCGWDLYSFLTDEQVRYLALQVFGSTLPAVIKLVEGLTIVGDGDCPQCGANNRTGLTGGYEGAQFDGDHGGWLVIGHRCNICNWEDYR